jgi:DNA-binding Lrp family transcriptional regulator
VVHAVDRDGILLSVDALDARILLAVDDDPDATSLELARRLGIARNTLSARLTRLRTTGVIGQYSRRVDPAALGRGLVAFISVELSQTTGQRATAALRAVPEVIEMHAITGQADLLLKVVARDTTDLHRITGELLAVPEVVRTSTVISLLEEMPLRVRALLEQVAQG